VTTFFDKFKLGGEKEDIQTVIANIDNGVAFRGTNLWILIFAIFVASLGLNVNSTAVIIGAMLISPLMGPIMGIGLGMGINDTVLLKKAIYNYWVATGVALSTSTIYFLVSPLNEAHSEILARTSPTIYDVLIAFFGGLAGIVAISSKHKGNVIPGVAIATALMPPLCTAGYGLATLQYSFFFGAFYLYIINTVFIALATLMIVRFLHFPEKRLQNEKAEKIAHRITYSVVLLTLLPSVYFGYDLVQKSKFVKNANRFIANEAHFQNDYLLNKKIDPKSRNIQLVFGGNVITEEEINDLKARMKNYQLENTSLEIKQGFSYLAEDIDNQQNEQLRLLNENLRSKDQHYANLQKQLDSIKTQQKTSQQVFAELKTQYPNLENAVIQPTTIIDANQNSSSTLIIILSFSRSIPPKEKTKIESWLKIRLNSTNVKLILQ